MSHARARFLLTRVAALAALLAVYWTVFGGPVDEAEQPPQRLVMFEATGDGVSDDTDALQRWIDDARARGGVLRFRPGKYRITQTLEVRLNEIGPVSLSGDGVARLVMDGPGPALKLIGTHEGTASPDTVQPEVWAHERMPLIDGIEIVGRHHEASGIELTGTMQATITRVTVRDALHGIHLTERNRNVQISDCHIYDNRGVGIYLDGVNLHQINVVGCHVSYNDGGGIVCKGSEVRNLQVGTCDIEGNMGGPESEPTANILLDSTGASVAEVAIVGCTIQHTHDAPGSANIRINGESTPRPFTDELRHGYITIADNVLSDVQVNIEIKNAIGVTVTGNTVWKGYEHNLLVENSERVVVSDNVFDRNPRYHYGDGAEARLGLVFRDSRDCILSGNAVTGVRDARAAVTLERCRWMNVTGCLILDSDNCGLLLEDCEHCRVSDCIIRDDRAEGAEPTAVRIIGGGEVQVDGNLFSGEVVR